MAINTPPLALGQAVHEVLEALSDYGVKERMNTPLVNRLELVWEKVEGKKGGFKDKTQEEEYKARAVQMLTKLQENPGVLLNKAVKIESDFIPNYWLSEKDNLILCGKIDWLEYLPKNNSVHIVDFKTGKNTENEGSLQLPIYLLLATNTQKRKVEKASYWYLDNDLEIIEKELPDIKEAYDTVFNVANRIKLARQLNRFVCPYDGCRNCLPYERILKGEGERVGISGTNQDIYILKN